MFDQYVRRSELEAERERRIRAESEAAFLRGENTRLLTALENEREAHDGERQTQQASHAEQVSRILEHLAPLAPTFGTNGPDLRLVPKSPAELLAEAMSEPAVGPAAIAAKRNKIAALQALVNESIGRASTETTSDDDLTEDEEARIAAKVG